jgi:hypothetical protein
MRRSTMGVLALVLSLSLGLGSCDQLFEVNFFAKATHPPVSAGQILSKSAVEIGDMLKSAEYLSQLSKDFALRDAVLSRLESIYKTSADPATVQSAAMLAADFRIASDPAASFVSSAILGAISNLSSGSMGPADVGSIVKGLVPPDIMAEIDSANTKVPQSFIDMIKAFQGASKAYVWLGQSLGLSPAPNPNTSNYYHVYALEVAPDQALPVAVNALLSGLLASLRTAGGSVEPAAVANAIWQAILAPPEMAGNYLQVDPKVIETLVSPNSYVANLLEAASFSFALASDGGTL